MILRIKPNEYDVLMGQSPNLRLHPGNLWLKELVAESFEEYFDDRTSKLDKTLISRNIIQTVQKKGRFLKQPQKKRISNPGDAVWILETDPVRIRDKVASQFRGHLKEQKRKNIDHNTRKQTDETCSRLRGGGDKHTERNNAPLKEVVRNLPLKKRKVELSHCDFKEEHRRRWNEFSRAKRPKISSENDPTKQVNANIQTFYDISRVLATSAVPMEVPQENRIESVQSSSITPTPVVSTSSNEVLQSCDHIRTSASVVSIAPDDLSDEGKAIDNLIKFEEWSGRILQQKIRCLG